MNGIIARIPFCLASSTRIIILRLISFFHCISSSFIFMLSNAQLHRYIIIGLPLSPVELLGCFQVLLAIINKAALKISVEVLGHNFHFS